MLYTPQDVSVPAFRPNGPECFSPDRRPGNEISGWFSAPRAAIIKPDNPMLCGGILIYFTPLGLGGGACLPSPMAWAKTFRPVRPFLQHAKLVHWRMETSCHTPFPCRVSFARQLPYIVAAFHVPQPQIVCRSGDLFCPQFPRSPPESIPRRACLPIGRYAGVWAEGVRGVA